jgi:hypothetical protein
MCALVYIYKCAAQKTADSGTTQARAAGDVEANRQRRDEAPAARRWRLGIFTLAPRRCCAGFSVLSRWLLDVTALVHRYFRAGSRHCRAEASAWSRFCTSVSSRYASGLLRWRGANAHATALILNG